MRGTPGIEAADRLLSVTTVAFDIAALELLLPLCVGASVYVAPSPVVMDGRGLAQLVASYRPTIMQATPAAWKMLLDAGWSGDSDLKILCGGEALPLELARNLLARCRSLWNMYGPTETTVWSTVHRVSALDESPSIPIGRPIDATQIYILDVSGQLVPRGVGGEIHIGGAGVANGYFRNPELTAQRFLADPFAGGTARMYRTGDVGRWRVDGALEYLGRLDHQIKMRGFRIEPAEIEVAIKATGEVRDVVVVARDHGHGDARLVAYCVVEGADGDDADLSVRLIEALSRQLPSYMIPSVFVPMLALPQTANGKIDRSRLPAPAWGRNVVHEQYEAPRDELETRLTTLWQDILGIPRIGIRDDFFMLGGHSLVATRLFAALGRNLDVHLPLSVLFERPTIEYLAERIRALRASDESDPATKFSHLVPIQERGSRPPLFCVHGAGGNVLNFWALSRYLGAEQPFYALQAAAGDGREMPYDKIEVIAARYLEELRSVQPCGPYYLSGYCGGGWVALEMARLLRAAGERVALLVLLDSYGPKMRLNGEGPAWHRGVFRNSPRRFAKRSTAWLLRNYEHWSQQVRIRYHRRAGRVVPHELRNAWLLDEFLTMAEHYRPDQYDGEVVLVLAKDVEAPSGAAESNFGWAGLTPANMQVFHVPGTHLTLTEHPNVAVLASTLAGCLSAADRAVG